MKKIVSLLLVISLMLTTSSVFAENELSVTINGNAVSFADQKPVIVDGRTLVPFRAIAEAIGGIVEWDDEYKIVYIASGTKGSVRMIGMQIGNPVIEIIDYLNAENGVEMKNSIIETDVPASIINSRTMVPLRVIGDVFGAETGWNQESKTASVTLDMSNRVAATDDECKKFVDENYFKAKHILITENENRTDAEAKSLADEITNKIKGGEDFDKLMTEYSEDPGSKTYPDGYIFTTGEMVEAFEQAVKTLKVDEYTQSPVKSEYGYHIIKRVSFSDKDYEQAIEAVKFLTLAKLAGLEF